jgi:hypothetical protein
LHRLSSFGAGRGHDKNDGLSSILSIDSTESITCG